MQEQVGIKLVGKIVDEVGTYVDEAVVEEEAEHGGGHRLVGGDPGRHHGLHDVLRAGAGLVVVADREVVVVTVGGGAREEDGDDQRDKPRCDPRRRHGNGCRRAEIDVPAPRALYRSKEYIASRDVVFLCAQ